MDGLPSKQGIEVEDSAEMERVVRLVKEAIEGDVRRMAEAIVSKRDDELLGPGEFDLRDKVLKAAGHILEAALNDRKKRGIEAAARIVPAVAATRVSWGGVRRPS